jgi:hypothetical protein
MKEGLAALFLKTGRHVPPHHQHHRTTKLRRDGNKRKKRITKNKYQKGGRTLSLQLVHRR